MKKLSVSVPLVCLILIGSIWFTGFYYLINLSSEYIRYSRSQFLRSKRLCFLQLSLHAAGVRYCAEKIGRLPESLYECEKDIPGIENMINWVYGNNDIVYEDIIDKYLLKPGVINEPWLKTEGIVGYSPGTPPPSASQDIFGLPIIYSEGRLPPEKKLYGISSSDKLPTIIKGYLEQKQMKFRKKPEIFSLSSLFIEYSVQKQKRNVFLLNLLIFILSSGVTSIGTLIIVVIKYWKGPSTTVNGKISIAVSVITACFIVGFGLFCKPHIGHAYPFSTYLILKEERLKILDNALNDGKIAKEHAIKCIYYINTYLD